MSKCGFSSQSDELNNMDRQLVWAALTVVHEDIVALAKQFVEHNSDDDCVFPHDMADSYIAFAIGNNSIITEQALDAIRKQMQGEVLKEVSATSLRIANQYPEKVKSADEVLVSIMEKNDISEVKENAISKDFRSIDCDCIDCQDIMTSRTKYFANHLPEENWRRILLGAASRLSSISS